jgi:L-asparaginase
MTASQPRRRIGILYTGGTFGMVPSEHGLVPSHDLPARAEPALRESLRAPASIEWLDHGWPPLASADIGPALWYDIARCLVGASDCDGFVVIHGTDTLAYTGSALSFLLAGLGRPVVITGARKPLGEPGSDALAHLIDAVTVAGSDANTGVTIAFGRRLLQANRTSKRFGTPDHPFTSPRTAPLADLANDEIPAPQPAHAPAWGPHEPQKPLSRPARVGVLPVYPGIGAAAVEACMGAHPDAILLEGYLSGLGPGGDAAFVEALRTAVAGGTVVGAIADSAHGSVRMGYYASSTPLADAGVTGGADMTREAALTKLHTSLSAGLGARETAAAFAQDQCGELSEGAD